MVLGGLGVTRASLSPFPVTQPVRSRAPHPVPQHGCSSSCRDSGVRPSLSLQMPRLHRGPLSFILNERRCSGPPRGEPLCICPSHFVASLFIQGGGDLLLPKQGLGQWLAPCSEARRAPHSLRIHCQGHCPSIQGSDRLTVIPILSWGTTDRC